MKNNPESGEFCCLHICLFNGNAIHFRTTLTPLRLLFLLYCVVLFTVNNIILLNACICPHTSSCYVSECVHLVNSSLCVNENE